ncbi:MAG: hypothetical protein H7Y27_06170 [Gemmatimonadaceae bacterium]|nr:hypothetical protein [Chitinophagaceae bacterium]
MKKLLFVLAIAATVTACNNEAGEGTGTDTTAAPTPDTTVVVAPDTTVVVGADTTKVDTTKK